MKPYTINPPESEVEFEKLCLELLKRHWSRKGLERFAKKGERQYGVDIFDTLGESPQYAAQCKLKEPGKSLSETEIRDVYGLYVEHNVAYLQWTFTTGGIVSAAPAVANGVVYVGSQDGTIYALLADSGAELWSFPTGGPILSSPAVVNGVVYVGSNDSNVYAFGLLNPPQAPTRPDPATLRPNLSPKE